MRAQPLIFCILLALCSLAACEIRHPEATTAAAPARRTQPAPVATQPPRVAAQPATSIAPTSADTASRLSQALGAKLEGYQLESFTTGDINEDNRPDFIAIFQEAQARDTTTYEPRGFRFRRVALILNQGWPQLRLAATNDNVIDCIGCAHMAIFDAYRGTTIKGPYFSFESTDGGCTRTMDVLTFRYSKTQKNWFLHKAGRDTYDCSGEEEWSHEEKTRRDFGRIAFEKFEFSPL